MAFIEVKNLTKTYQMGEVTIKALENVSFSIDKGELVVVLGPSGAGKTYYFKYSWGNGLTN